MLPSDNTECPKKGFLRVLVFFDDFLVLTLGNILTLYITKNVSDA